MVTAFIMVKVGGGDYQSWVFTIKEKLEKLPEVVETTCVFGRYDVIVKVEVESLPELTRLVGDKIRSIPGVETTETFVAHEG